MMALLYSVDLSATFDLVRPGIFVQKALRVVEDPGLVWLIYDYITERKAFVEVGCLSSLTFSLDVGCPQGSTLGPKVFNIYCHDLIDAIDEGQLVSYTDDSYVVVESDNLSELEEKASRQMQKHIEWLSQNGMVCNIEKSEAMVLGEGVSDGLSLTISNNAVLTSNQMRVLGITFDDRLSWKPHVDSTVKRTNRVMHGLKLIRRYVSKDQARVIVTAYYFSILYYGCEVWLHKHLSFHLKQKIRSCHYKALRLIYGTTLSREELNVISQRATPDEWADYSIAKATARMVLSAQPKRLLCGVLMNAYSERRQQGRLFFYDDSQRKIGRQRLRNRLQSVSRMMKFKWLETSLSAVRPNLKKCLFSYIKAQNGL